MSCDPPPSRDIKVLHIIDGLGGGGSERWVFDIVRFTSPRINHRVITVAPCRTEFVYANRLYELGVYHSQAPVQLNGHATLDSIGSGLGVASLAGRCFPKKFRPYVRSLWHRVKHRSELLHSFAQNQIEYLLAGRRVIKEFSSFKPNIVHAHTFDGFAFGVRLRRLTGTPLVYHFPCLISQLEGTDAEWVLKWFRRYHRFVDVFFAAAGYETELQKLGVTGDRVVPIYGVLDLQATERVFGRKEQHRLEVLRSLGVPDNARVLLSVGRMDPSKGHRYTLEALPAVLCRLPNVYWILCGEGWERSQLTRRAEELGVDTNVRFPGFIDDPLPFYAAADLYMRTNVFEGDNLSSYQAMACGVPVVGFDTGCATDLLPTVGHGIRANTGDATDLANAICSLLTLSGSDRGRLGTRGREFCLRHLSIQQAIADVESSYERLAKAPVCISTKCQTMGD